MVDRAGISQEMRLKIRQQIQKESAIRYNETMRVLTQIADEFRKGLEA
jgi:hypothetical protein